MNSSSMLSVWFDDTLFLEGLWSSAHVVFRNLNGANFNPDQVAPIQNYVSSREQYLADVASMSDFPLVEGTIITLRSGDGRRTYLTHELGADAAGETREGEHYDEYLSYMNQEAV